MESKISVRCAIPNRNFPGNELHWLMVERLATEEHQAGVWEFPGGTAHHDFNKPVEDLEEAIRRECQEEVGITPINLHCVIKNQGIDWKGRKNNTWQILFYSDTYVGEPIANLTQVASAQWIPDDTLLWYPTTKLTRHFFQNEFFASFRAQLENI